MRSERVWKHLHNRLTYNYTPTGGSPRMSILSPRRSYATDLTDAQWHLIEPLLPGPAWTGRHRTVDLREVVNALLYLLRTGRQWRLPPHDFPNHHPAPHCYDLWAPRGLWPHTTAALVAPHRSAAGC